jgi:hypothetical protein
LIVGSLIPYMLAGMLSVPSVSRRPVYGYHVSFAGNLGIYLVFAVKISLSNPDHTLKPGMPADAIFQSPASS